MYPSLAAAADTSFTSGGYVPWTAYGQSKTGGFHCNFNAGTCFGVVMVGKPPPPPFLHLFYPLPYPPPMVAPFLVCNPANILHAIALNKRLQASGVVAVSLHPGELMRRAPVCVVL